MGLSKWGRFIRDGKSMPLEYQGLSGEAISLGFSKLNGARGVNGGLIAQGSHQSHVNYSGMGKTKKKKGHIFVDEVPATRP